MNALRTTSFMVMGAAGMAVLFAAGAGCGSDSGGGAGGTAGGAGGASGGTGGAVGGAGGTGGGTGGAVGGAGGAGGGAGGAGGGTGGAGGAGGAVAVDCSNPTEEDVTADITTDTMWVCKKIYVLKKKIHVLGGATLTIQRGTTILGDGDSQNPAALISTREGKLIAVGTKEQPIVFTSSADPGTRRPGDSFAGVAMLGKASINNGTCVNDGDPNTTACDAPGFMQTVIEGLAADDPKGQYGGTDDAFNCGEVKYARFEFGGFILAANNELNGLTLGGCGTGTKISYVQAHLGQDDGVEIFGGTVNVSHLVLTENDDDQLDFDNGWRGSAQFVIIHQATGREDKGIEADNLGGNEAATPRTNTPLWNFTMIGRPAVQGVDAGTVGMHLREGMRGHLRNFIVLNFGQGAVDVDAVQVNPNTEWPDFLSIEHSVFFGGPLQKATDTNDMSFDEAAAIMNAARMNVTNVDPMLGSINPRSPNYVPANTALNNKATPPANMGLDTTANYAGAVKPGTAPADAWYAGWTTTAAN